MDPRNPSNEDDGPFYDASDDFPFYDCVDSDETEKPFPTPIVTLRRRRPSRDSNQDVDQVRRPSWDRERDGSTRTPASMSSDEKVASSTTTTADGDGAGDALRSSVRAPSLDRLTGESSTITEADGDLVDDSVDTVNAPEDPPSSLLVSLVELLIKAIGFQFTLLISMLTFPFWCLYAFFMFIVDPFSTMKHGRDYITLKLSNLWRLIQDCVSPLIYQWLKEHESVWKLISRFGWGLFWAIYVCSILLGLLVTATLISGFAMRYLVKEPIRIEEKLNFDYTKDCPVAYVAVASCSAVDSGVKSKELMQVMSNQQSRVIPPNHKLEASVTLQLPESEYNKNLGIFQIRVDFMSSDGEKLASSSHPCMLLFKSQPVRLMLTALKLAPLIAGYISESQTIKVKFHGFTEGNVPTACLRVLVEQRAEFRPGAGIPEIYDASLILESELPLLRRFLWSWRRTVFIWTVMAFFTMELVFALLCCRPVILPRTKRSNGSVRNNAPRNDSLAR